MSPTSRPRRRTTVLVIASVIVLLLVATVLVMLNQPSASASVLEPINTPDQNGFLPAAGTDSPQPLSATDIAGNVDGDQPGLFVDAGANACLIDSMIARLRADPPRASSWVQEAGTTVRDLPAYLRGMTAVLLGSDTAVTEHIYHAGRAESYGAVLQRGTAVLVTDVGKPAVKCLDADPLSDPGSGTPASYSGARWSGFDTGSIADIGAASDSVGSFQVVDPVTHQLSNRPASHSRIPYEARGLGAPWDIEAYGGTVSQFAAQETSNCSGSSATTCGTPRPEVRYQTWDGSEKNWVTTSPASADLNSCPTDPQGIDPPPSGAVCPWVHSISFDPPPTGTFWDRGFVPGTVATVRVSPPISTEEADVRYWLVKTRRVPPSEIDPDVSYVALQSVAPKPTTTTTEPTTTTTTEPTTTEPTTTTTEPTTTTTEPTTTTDTGTTTTTSRTRSHTTTATTH